MKKLLAIVGLFGMAIALNAAMVSNWSFQDSTPGSTGLPSGWSRYSSVPPIDDASITVVDSAGQFRGYYRTTPEFDYGGLNFVQMVNNTTTLEGIYQTVTLSAGQTVSGAIALTSSGGSLARAMVKVVGSAGYYDNNDEGQQIVSVSTSVSSSTWSYWSFTADVTGDYTFNFLIKQGTGLFDMSAVPEAKGWMMGGALVGIFGLATFLRRRQAKATA